MQLLGARPGTEHPSTPRLPGRRGGHPVVTERGLWRERLGTVLLSSHLPTACSIHPARNPVMHMHGRCATPAGHRVRILGCAHGRPENSSTVRPVLRINAARGPFASSFRLGTEPPTKPNSTLNSASLEARPPPQLRLDPVPKRPAKGNSAELGWTDLALPKL